MKNRIPFAALTFAFTVAGATVGHCMSAQPFLTFCVVAILAIIGGAAAACFGDS